MRAAPLNLTESDSRWLTGQLAAGEDSEQARRARIVLLAAEGLRNVEIAERLELSLPTVAKWRNRFAQSGVAGLLDLPRSGRPRTVDHRQVVEATLGAPPVELGVAHWSSRLLARHLGVGDATVARIWREYGIAPRPRGTYEFAVSPGLTARYVDVLGLYLTPTCRAAVLVVDEERQAAPRAARQGSRPVDLDCAPDRVPGVRSTREGADTGRAASSTQHSREFIRQIASAYPERELHVVISKVDAAGPVRDPQAAVRHPSLALHTVAADEQWLNLVEVWLLMMAARTADGRSLCPIDRVRSLVGSGQSAVWIKRPAGLGQGPTRWSGRRRRSGWERDSA